MDLVRSTVRHQMAFATSKGTRIYFEEHGSGVPILFLHEFGGDHRSWIDQVRYFGRGWRCITVAARGFPPSDMPNDDASYGQDIANADAIAVLDHLGIAKAHVVGLSMGAYTSLQLAAYHGDRLFSASPGGAGSGSEPATRDAWQADARQRADVMQRLKKIDGREMGWAANRVQLLNKDPMGWNIFARQLGEHPPEGQARVLRAVQARRTSLYDMEAVLAAVTVPVLLMVGDEDEPCLDVNLWMKRLMPTAQLALFPGTGHLLNCEEPALTNLFLERFLTSVERGTWRPRDPRAVPTAAGPGTKR
jgi:pimeloyl-ACP methyl ester carboxylesterase